MNESESRHVTRRIGQSLLRASIVRKNPSSRSVAAGSPSGHGRRRGSRNRAPGSRAGADESSPSDRSWSSTGVRGKALALRSGGASNTVRPPTAERGRREYRLRGHGSRTRRSRTGVESGSVSVVTGSRITFVSEHGRERPVRPLSHYGDRVARQRTVELEVFTSLSAHIYSNLSLTRIEMIY